MTEELFEIKGADGLVRRGVVSRPDKDNTRSVGIVLLPAGLKYRVGPHRFYVSLSRRLAGEGYMVLRFDPLGIGESDGVLQRGLIGEIWRKIQSGGYVNDTLLACQAMRDSFGLKRIIAGGICGGAITAQLSAAKQPQTIEGVLSISTVVNLSPVQKLTANSIGSAQADHDFHGYLRKLISGDAWIRIIKLESDFSAIGRTLVARARDLMPFRGHRAKTYSTSENPKFMESFYQLERNGVNHLLLFSGNDSRWFEFKDMVLDGHLAGRPLGNYTEIKVIAEADHELQFSEWQNAAHDIVREWLDRNFGNVMA
jgi:pimeloyl-ACP methyl ester carboxylesterase